jgi:hypothetical protein
MLSVVTAATKNYIHAFPQCMRAIATAASHHSDAHFIFCTDESKDCEAAAEIAKRELPEGWKVTVLKFPFKDDEKNYKEEAQLRIAALQGSGFAFARRIKSTMCLSVESDTIIPANALRMLEWTLKMPDAVGDPYYDIAAATYPNGLFLGGFGTPQNHIAEDFLPEERKIKPRLKLLLDKCEERIKAIPQPESESDVEKYQKLADKEGKRMRRLREFVKKSPPLGNVFELNAKKYRRRGWMDFAYPGIGKGAIVPSDWCGLGCTLLSERALALSNFTGYDGKGTQDLFLCWKRWNNNGLRIACVPHVACDHIKKEDGKIVHYHAYHETEGECKGHLRVSKSGFVPV